MLLAMGDGQNYDAGWDWMEQFCAQLDGKILDGSSKVPKGVADGEYAVGLSHELYFASYRDSGIEAVWPEEGSAVITGPAQIIKGCPNLENAKKFMEYVLGKDFQTRYMEQHNARTVRSDVAAPEGVPAFDTLKTFEEPIVTSEEQAAVIQKFQDLVFA
jgi:iron(III) transport system substrate-binding protein